MTTRTPSVFCCTITPFAADLSLDEDAIRLLVDRLGAGGVGAFIGTSSPGEGFALSLKELERLYTVAKEAMAGRAQVRGMGVEPHSADEAYELIKVAEACELDAMQLYSLDLSHGNKPMPSELEAFFRTNLERMTIPAVLSTHSLLGYLIPLDVMERLLNDYPGIIGINCSTQDTGYLGRVLELCEGRADVHVGGPHNAITNFAMGGQGFLCTEAIIAPKLVGSILKHHIAGEYDEMCAAFHRLSRMTAVNVWPGGSIRFTKAALRAVGLPGWYTRPPYLPLPDSDLVQIKKGLEALQIPETEGLAPLA